MSNTRAIRFVDTAVVGVALVLGGLIGYIDSRPTWDDTGITVGALLLVAGACALVRPRVWWAVALFVGLPVPLLEFRPPGSTAPLVAVAVAFVASGIGAVVGRTTGLSNLFAGE